MVGVAYRRPCPHCMYMYSYRIYRYRYQGSGGGGQLTSYEGTDYVGVYFSRFLASTSYHPQATAPQVANSLFPLGLDSD